MASGSARKLLSWAGMVGLTTYLGACIPPPGFEPVLVPETRPEVLVETVDPPAYSAINVGDRGCPPSFVVRADLDDFDDTQLQLRWVANNGIPGKRTIPINDETGFKLTGTPVRASERIVPAQYFPDEYDLARDPATRIGQTVILSLFATDAPAPAWAVEDPTDTGDAQELGRIRVNAGEEDWYGVVRVDWTFVLLADQGECLP